MEKLLQLIPLTRDIVDLIKLDPEVKEDRQKAKSELLKKPKWRRKFFKRMSKMLAEEKRYNDLKGVLEELEEDESTDLNKLHDELWALKMKYNEMGTKAKRSVNGKRLKQKIKDKSNRIKYLEKIKRKSL